MQGKIEREREERREREREMGLWHRRKCRSQNAPGHCLSGASVLMRAIIAENEKPMGSTL